MKIFDDLLVANVTWEVKAETMSFGALLIFVEILAASPQLSRKSSTTTGCPLALSANKSKLRLMGGRC